MVWEDAPSSPLCVLCKMHRDMGKASARVPLSGWVVLPLFGSHPSIQQTLTPQLRSRNEDCGGTNPWLNSVASLDPKIVLRLHPRGSVAASLSKNDAKLGVRARRDLS